MTESLLQRDRCIRLQWAVVWSMGKLVKPSLAILLEVVDPRIGFFLEMKNRSASSVME